MYSLLTELIHMAEKPKDGATLASPAGGKAISNAPIRRIMKGEGAFLVAEDAVDCLVEYLEGLVKKATLESMKIAESDKREKITGDDITEALKKL